MTKADLVFDTFMHDIDMIGQTLNNTYQLFTAIEGVAGFVGINIFALLVNDNWFAY